MMTKNKVLNEFKQYSKLGNQSFKQDSTEINKSEMKSKRQINKSFVRNIPEVNFESRSKHVNNDLKNTRSISYTKLNDEYMGRRHSDDNIVTAANNLKDSLNNLVLSQRPSEFRNITQSPIKVSNEISPSTKRSRILHAMKAEPKQALSLTPFTKSKLRNLEKSSGAYGNFASIDQIDKALKELSNRKNHSIAYY